MKKIRLPKIKVTGRVFKFMDEAIPPTDALGVVVLRVIKSRQFYDGKFSGTAHRPICRSVSGIVPVKDTRPGAVALSRSCIGCPQNRKDTPYRERCNSLWSLVALTEPDWQPRLMFFNQPCQWALIQWAVQLQDEVNENPGLGMQDFSCLLKLRKDAKGFSLAYPVKGNEFHPIRFVDGQSKFQKEFERFDPASQQRAADELVLNQLIGQCRTREESEEIRAVQEAQRAEVDEVLDALVEI
jgi:hypothetical protein